MDVHVRVDLDENGPVVVKSGTGAAVEHLRHERERLEQAVHPGVVALAGGSGGRSVAKGSDEGGGGGDHHELRICYAGEPLSRWSGSVAGIAGVGAAVASTLADLHDVGIVHGRLDASHILIGDDGRPRLCGLSRPGGAAPSDDVAALGAVLDDLLGRAPAHRRGPWRRHRSPAGERRALRQVIERATDRVPTRRPSARLLADAILSAVPTASLPSGSDRATARRRPALPAQGDLTLDGIPTAVAAGNRGPADPDTLDRIWSLADERSDDERWAAAFGAGPLDLPLTPDDPTLPFAADDPTLPFAEVHTPEWATTAQGERDPWTADTGDGWATGTGGRGQVGVDADAGPSGPGRARGRTANVSLDDDLTRDHHAVAGLVTVTPRPVRGDGEVDAGRDRSSSRARRIAATAGVVVVVGMAIAGAVILGSGGVADTSRSEPPQASGLGGACPPAAEPAADVDGDGCPEVLAVDGGTIDAGVASWALGEPGDLVTVGDWDCDGDASAALLRPTTGDVFVFSAWAEVDQPLTVSSSQRVEGGVGIRADHGDSGDRACDQLLVDLAAGGTASVEVAG